MFPWIQGYSKEFKQMDVVLNKAAVEKVSRRLTTYPADAGSQKTAVSESWDPCIAKAGSSRPAYRR